MNTILARATTANSLNNEDQSRQGFFGCETSTPDDELLQKFTSGGDHVAFERLVSRHAAIVMGVCRRALGSEQDAEDAFQATFLVLARKAATVRRGASLSAWLYKTAYRISIQARAKRARRKEEALEVEPMSTNDTFANIASDHEQALLDEEFNRLPEKYRLPLFLCCVEGRSRDEAAEQLGISQGAVKGRLERGRHLLRRRLVMRGVTLSAVMGVLAGLPGTAHAAQSVAASLISSSTQGGVEFAAGKGVAGIVSQNAVSLANANLQILPVAVLQAVACVFILVIAVAGSGAIVQGPNASMYEEFTLAEEEIEERTPLVVTFASSLENSTFKREDEAAALSDDSEGNVKTAKNKRCCKQRQPQAVAATTSSSDTGDLIPTPANPNPASAEQMPIPRVPDAADELVSVLVSQEGG